MRDRRRRALAVPTLALAFALPAAAARAECDAGLTLRDGLCLSAEATLDAHWAARGGARTGTAAIGQLRVVLSADLEALFGLPGWRAEVSGFGILGRQITLDRVGSLAPVSNIEALPTARLFEAWIEAPLGTFGSLRFGQLAADSEFAGAFSAGTLTNGTFGWPVALAGALPSGGPAYPLATPGVRLALGDLEQGTGVRLGLFSGDPGGRYVDSDAQRHNRHGLAFSRRGGAFLLGEVVTGGDAPNPDAPRRWVLTLGGWYHTGGFDDVRFDAAGLSLADPQSGGAPRRQGNNHGGYAVGEVTVWRGAEGWVALFGRAFAQPGSRNAVSVQFDAGVAWRGPFGRSDDTLAVGVSWARIGAASRDFNRDQIAFGAVRPVQTHETVVEVSYEAPVTDWLTVRPMVQLLLNPAAREPDPRRSATRALPDAAVFGVRLSAAF
jgi:porin